MAATGIAFRDTADYVTDGPTDTYSLNESYPVTRAGITFGTEDATNFANRNAGIDPRLAGIWYATNDGSSQRRVRIDASPNDYSIRIALGDAAGGQAYQYLQLRDDTTPVATIDDTNGTTGFDDATGTDYSAANWPASNTPITITLASSILRIVIGSPTAQSNSSTLAYIQFVAQVTAKPSHYYQMLRNG